MAEPPKLTAIPIKLRPVLAKIAAYLKTSIVQRAFPDSGSAGKSVKGEAFRPLSPKYARYKSGAMRNASDAARKRSWAMRVPPKGWGPRVKELGTSRRLDPRSPQPDQRLTNLTAKGFGVVRQDDYSVTLGMRDSRSQTVGWELEKRNKWFGATPDEEMGAHRIFATAVGEQALKSLKLSQAQLKIEIHF